jgi:hypothetical protein
MENVDLQLSILEPLHTQAKHRDHEIVRAQKKCAKEFYKDYYGWLKFGWKASYLISDNIYNIVKSILPWMFLPSVINNVKSTFSVGDTTPHVVYN